MQTLTKRSTADDVLAGLDLAGKNYLLTGCVTGKTGGFYADCRPSKPYRMRMILRFASGSGTCRRISWRKTHPRSAACATAQISPRACRSIMRH